MKAQHQSGSGGLGVANDIHLDVSRELMLEASVSMKPKGFGPAVAEQYAAMIARYWREAQRLGQIDRERPLDVLDLCPGDGMGGALLIGAIRRRIGSAATAAIRYLPLRIDRFFVDSDFDFTGISPRWRFNGGSLHFSAQHCAAVEGTSYRAENPLVVVAHDAWSQLPQELFAIHYGKLLRANLSTLRSEAHDAEKNCWDPVEDQSWDYRLHSLLAHYRMEFNSSPLVYPLGGLRILDSILAIAPRGAFVLACSPGSVKDLSLRLTSFNDVTVGYRDSGYLPTNFRFFAEWVRSQCGVAAEVELPDQRVLQTLMLGGEAHGKDVLDAVLRCVDVSLLASSTHLVEVVRNLGGAASLDLRLVLLHMSRFDPAVFRAGAGDLLRALSQPGQPDLHAWRDALNRVWQNHLLCHSTDDLSTWLAQAAMHCGHWGLARAILRQSLAEQGENSNDLANLAWCEARTGRLGKAIELVTRALGMDSVHSLAIEVSRRLEERLALRDSCWKVELQDSALPIILEPLDASHAHALSHQYRDAQIAVMTGLPVMSDPDKVRQWILESDQDPGRVNYAVMHQDWGFVGFINLAVSGHAAFFCFWTGVDFQGQGFATAASRLACRHAAACGVPLMLTSAYKDNHRSLRALERLGFNELAVRALPPDHERIFFSLVDTTAAEAYDCDAELVAYYRRENLPMEFVIKSAADAPLTCDVDVAGSME